MTSDQHNFTDFTTQHYRSLLGIAKKNYKFIRYTEINEAEKFILWRHDCDFSLNRALQLAYIETEIGVNSTFFLNPHSEFYNINEKEQTNIIKTILSLGHDIALHFDSSFYDIDSEEDLNFFVSREASWLEQWYEQKIHVFSFHNPTEFNLRCQAERYGGLLNCYSSFFKEKVPYCSDSNGYWRFRRLQDVLSNASDPCLQVLTHPGWWQDEAMEPRKRIQRCSQGRANAQLKFYDRILEYYDRKNIGLSTE